MFVSEIGKWLVSNAAVYEVYTGTGDAAMRPFAGCLHTPPRFGGVR